MQQGFLELVDPQRWQSAQDYFAEIIGTSIRVVDDSGAPLTTLSKPHAYCTQVIGASAAAVAQCKDCYLHSQQSFPPAGFAGQHDIIIDTPQPSHYDSCPFFINRVVIPICGANDQVLAHIVMGPIILGRRRSYPEYVSLTKNLDLDISTLVEGIEKVRIFSFETIKFVAGLFQEVAYYIIENRRPPFTVARQPEAAAEVCERREMPFHFHKMLRALFETASEGVEAERGSLMLFDESGTTLSIKMAKGLPDDVIAATRVAVGEGLAGWVAQEQKPLFISREFTNPRLLSRLSQPQLSAALLMPIQGKKICLGVLSLSTTQEVHRFSQENIKVIEQLVKMVDVTMGSLGET